MGRQWQVLDPGIRLVPDSADALRWSRELGLPFYEAAIETATTSPWSFRTYPRRPSTLVMRRSSCQMADRTPRFPYRRRLARLHANAASVADRVEPTALKWVAPLIRRGFVSEACEVDGAGGVEGFLRGAGR